MHESTMQGLTSGRNMGFRVSPKDTFTCAQEKLGIEPSIMQMLDNRSTNIDVPQDKLLQKHKCSMCQGTHTSTNTHAEPRVFLSVTYTIVTTEPCGLGKLQTKSSLCLLPANPMWLLAVTQLHYYLPMA